MAATAGRILFDQTGTRKYHTGVSALALFVMSPNNSTDTDVPTAPTDSTITGGIAKSLYKAGVAWNGITTATNSPSGGDETELWADNIKYGSMRAAEKSGGTIECYQYPPEFEVCNGNVISNGVVVGQQARTKFGFCYKSNVGNDQSTDAGECLHIVWNCSTSPSEHSNNTVNDSPDAGTFSFQYSSDSVAWTNSSQTLKPCSTMDIDTTTLTNGKNNANYKYLCDCLYGRDADATTTPETAGIAAQLLSPDDVLAIMGRTLPSG